MNRTVVAFLALAALIPGGDAPQPGDKRTLSVKAGWIPVLADEAAYRRFCAAVRRRDGKALRSLAFDDGKLAFRRKPSEVEVVEAVKDSEPPAAIVKAADGKPVVGTLETAVVPLSLLGETGGDLPAFDLVPASPPVRAAAGAEMVLFREGDFDVPLTKDLLANEEYLKLALAKDSVGIEKMAQSGRLFYAPKLTRVLVLERHSNRFLGKGIVAVEGRVIDGEHADKVFWCPEAWVVQLDLKITAPGAKAVPKRRR
jgi:hypothetical protein